MVSHTPGGEASEGRRGTTDRSPRRPRILFVNQYYWPDLASTAQHLDDLATYLAAAGYDCHVLCGRGTYRAESDGSERPTPMHEVRDGVTIHRVPSTGLGRRSTWRRMVDYLSFYLFAILRAFVVPRPDLVVTLTTPPLIGLVGRLLRLRGGRHVVWSMDLHPEASIALGKMDPSRWWVRTLLGLAGRIDRGADRVVALGPYMARRLEERGVSTDRITEIGVWSRADELRPRPRDGHPMRSELGIGDRFTLMYSGNMGLAHRFEEVIEAARALRHREDILFLFVGAGPRRGEIEAARDRLGLTNLRLFDYVPRERLEESLTIADAHLITLRDEMVGLVVPGKLYGAMASGRPCLFVGPEASETAEAIRTAGCGVSVPAGQGDRLAEVIAGLASDPGRVTSLGRAARDGFLERHEREEACRLWFELVRGLIGEPMPERLPHTTNDARLSLSS